MRKRNNRHYSIYIAWILLLLCLITGLKSGLEKNAAGKKESYPGISIQSRWEELWKTVSSKDREEESESKDKTPEKDVDSQRNIRVLIMTDGYQQIVHREVEISAAGGLRIEKKDGLEETAGNEKIKIIDTYSINLFGRMINDQGTIIVNDNTYNNLIHHKAMVMINFSIEKSNFYYKQAGIAFQLFLLLCVAFPIFL